MKTIKWLKFLLVIVVSAVLFPMGCSGSDDSNGNSKSSEYTIPVVVPDNVPSWTVTENSKRVVAYFPSWDDFNSVMENNLDFDVVNYVNISFVNPDEDGNLTVDEGAMSDTQIKTLVTKAHAKNAKVLISIGGGDGPDYSTYLAEEARSGFITKILSYLTSHDLDGIDVDIEGQILINNSVNYNKFIREAKSVLSADTKLITAALASSWTGDSIDDETVQKFDFINIMGYDDNWDENKPHASYQYALDLLDYWVTEKKLSPEKACLGVPFYGYNGKVGENEMSYKEIIDKWPDAWKTDQVESCTYNGAPTIAKKTQLARYYGGIMIWAISHDAIGEKALLKVIDANNF